MTSSFSVSVFPSAAYEKQCQDDEDSVEEFDELPLEWPPALQTKQIFTGSIMSFHDCTVRQLIRQVDNWAYNRVLNAEHVKTIKESLLAQKYPHLMGTIKIVCDPNGSKRIIDGQHRTEAIRQILSEDIEMLWTMNVMVEMYALASIESREVLELYQTANNNLNVKPEDDPDLGLITLLDAIMADPLLSGGVIDKQDGRVNKPRISKKDLFEAFKAAPGCTGGLPTRDVVARIKQINAQISMLSNKDLYGRRAETTSQLRLKQRQRAQATNFFLNLDSVNWGIEKWPRLIRNMN